MDQTRRALLRTAALAGVGGLAGCSALSGDDTNETTTGTASNGSGPANGTGSDTGTDASTSASGVRSTGQWFPAPSVAERDGYAFVTLRPAAMAEFGDALPDARTANFETEIGLDGFETVGTLRSIHQTGIGLTVFDGPFDRSPLVEQLTGANFSDDGRYQGFQVYTADAQRAVGVGDEQVAQVDLRPLQVSVDSGSVLQGAIDAYTGDGDRYEAVDGDVSTVLSTLEGGHVINYQPGSTALQTDDAVAQGGRWRIGSDTTAIATAIAFESEGATDAATVESWATAAGPFGEVAPSVSTDGRVVTARADVSTGDLGPFAISTTDDSQPEIALDFEYDSDAGTVTITHQGGDSVPADRIEIRGNGFAERTSADQSGNGQWAGETSGGDSTVVAGDSVVVGVTPSYQLFVLYSSGSGNSVTLGTDSGPDA